MLDYHDVRDIFDVIVTSYGEKIAKPNKEIYLRVTQKLGVLPEECVFIDDFKRNIIPAKELGIKTILFRNFKQLKEDLSKLGIKIS